MHARTRTTQITVSRVHYFYYFFFPNEWKTFDPALGLFIDGDFFSFNANDLFSISVGFLPARL